MPPERIAEGARDLQALLGEHGFLPGVAGHASAGNLHFMLTPDFAKQEDLERYEAFMTGLVELIVDKYDGSLKAEHGTGINMAPYVEREWGEQATELMWRVKQLADPDGVLSPGVVLNRDPGAHLRNLKTTPQIEESANTCVECGFCEPVCPSRNLTTTPRQRIVLRREMARQPDRLAGAAGAAGGVRVRGARDLRRRRLLPARLPGRDRHRQVRQGNAHARATPSGPKGWRWRRRSAGARSRAPAAPASASARSRAAPSAARRCRRRPPASCPRPSTRAPPPSTSPPAPTASSAPPPVGRKSRPANRPIALGCRGAGRGLGAGGAAGLDSGGRRRSCCGLPWSSKGFGDAHRHKANEMVERLWLWSGAGALPIVVDAASCTSSIADPGDGVLSEENAERLGKLEILDSVAWAHDRLLPWLEVGEKVGSATVHPTCATRHLGLTHRLEALADALADDVHVAADGDLLRLRRRPRHLPPGADRRRHPPEASELAGRHFDARLSSNRTCEIGLERATGEPYESVILLLERLTRANSQ